MFDNEDESGAFIHRSYGTLLDTPDGGRHALTNVYVLVQ